jgi:hypothetical protein
LDLTIDVPSALLNVECVSLSTTFGSHHHLASWDLVSSQVARVLLES